MSENQNAPAGQPPLPGEREAIKDLIIRSYTPRYQFYVKRSPFRYPEPTSASLYGDLNGVIELLYGNDMQILLYNDLDAMIDDGWEPD